MITVLVNQDIGIHAVMVDGSGIKHDCHSAAIVIEAAFVTRETAVFRPQPRHLILGDNSFLAIKRNTVGLLVNITFNSGPEPIALKIATATDAQGQIGDDTPHARVMAAVFLFGSDKHLGSKLPFAQLRGISARNGIALASCVTAQRVGKDIRLQQVIVAGGVPTYVMLLARRVGGFTPHDAMVMQVVIGVHLEVGQGVALAFLRDKCCRLAL